MVDALADEIVLLNMWYHLLISVEMLEEEETTVLSLMGRLAIQDSQAVLLNVQIDQVLDNDDTRDHHGLDLNLVAVERVIVEYVLALVQGHGRGQPVRQMVPADHLDVAIHQIARSSGANTT